MYIILCLKPPNRTTNYVIMKSPYSSARNSNMHNVPLFHYKLLPFRRAVRVSRLAYVTICRAEAAKYTTLKPPRMIKAYVWNPKYACARAQNACVFCVSYENNSNTAHETLDAEREWVDVVLSRMLHTLLPVAGVAVQSCTQGMGNTWPISHCYEEASFVEQQRVVCLSVESLCCFALHLNCGSFTTHIFYSRRTLVGVVCQWCLFSMLRDRCALGNALKHIPRAFQLHSNTSTMGESVVAFKPNTHVQVKIICHMTHVLKSDKTSSRRFYMVYCFGDMRERAHLIGLPVNSDALTSREAKVFSIIRRDSAKRIPFSHSGHVNNPNSIIIINT